MNIPFLKRLIDVQGLLQERHLNQFQGCTVLVDYDSFFKQQVDHNKKVWYTEEEYKFEVQKIKQYFYSFVDTLLTKANPIFLLSEHYLQRPQPSESPLEQQKKAYCYPVLHSSVRNLFKKIVIGKGGKIEYVPMMTHHQAVQIYRRMKLEKEKCVIYSRSTVYHIYRCAVVHSLNIFAGHKDYGRLSYLYLPQCRQTGKKYPKHLKELSQFPQKLQLLGAFTMTNHKRKHGIYLQAMIVMVNCVMSNPPYKPATIQGLLWIIRCFKEDKKYAHIATDDFIRVLKQELFKIRCGPVFNHQNNRIEPLDIKLFEKYRNQEGFGNKSMAFLLGVDEAKELHKRTKFNNKLKELKPIPSWNKYKSYKQPRDTGNRNKSEGNKKKKKMVRRENIWRNKRMKKSMGSGSKRKKKRIRLSGQYRQNRQGSDNIRRQRESFKQCLAVLFRQIQIHNTFQQLSSDIQNDLPPFEIIILQQQCLNQQYFRLSINQIHAIAQSLKELLFEY